MTRMPIPLDRQPAHPRRVLIATDTLALALVCTLTAGLIAGALLTLALQFKK